MTRHPVLGLSVSSTLSLKLFERIIHSRLRRLAEVNGWFSPSQHGFRAKKSTETAALELVSTVGSSFRSKKIVA